MNCQLRFIFINVLLFSLLNICAVTAPAQPITVEGKPAQLDVRKAGENSIRITLKPVSFTEDFPYTPALSDKQYGAPVIHLREVTKEVKKLVGNLNVAVQPQPLTITITNLQGEPVQQLSFEEDGK